MSGAGDAVPFTPEDLAQARAAAEAAQREADAYCEWLRSPEGRAWVDQVLQECRAMAAAFEADCAAGKYALPPSELEQLQRDVILVKCHTRKSGGDPSE